MQRKYQSAIVMTLILALCLLVTSCASGTQGPGDQSSSGGSSPAEAGKPKYGGVLRAFIPTPTDDVNVRGSTCGVPQVHQPTWEGLLRWAPDNVAVPALAENWSSQDLQTWVFKLRQDVAWHDGKPFSAADVIATFDHMKRRAQPPNSNIGGTFLMDNKATYRAIDAQTVELKLQSPNVSVVPWFASCSTMMMSKAVMDRNGGPQEEWALGKEGDITSAVGTGPFKLTKHERDVQVVREKFPNYWGKDASGNKLPYLDGVSTSIIRDTALQFAAFRTGELDIWQGGYPIVLTSDKDALKAQLGDKITIMPGNSALFETLDLNNTHALLKQRDMRWAINLIVDRQELSQRVAEGNFVAAFMDPELFGAAALPLAEVAKMPGFRQPKTEDFAEARRLLATLGITPQTPVELNHPVRNYGFPSGAAQVIAKQLEPFGIKIKVNMMELAAASGCCLRTGNYDMNADLDSLKFRDPWHHIYAEADFSYNNTQPGMKWANEEAQKKLIDLRQEAVRTADEAKRNTLYHEIQRFLYTVDTPHINLGWEGTYHMWWNHLKGYKVLGGITEGLRFDAVWLEK